VIDLEGFRHHGSLEKLLGRHPADEDVARLSLHTRVTADSPPAFLWHTADDGAVAMQNSVLYALACREHRVRTELHIYESGHHGMGLAEGHAAISTWFDHAAAFLKRHLES